MAKYYYTANFEDPAVYHRSQQCEDGQRIEPRSRVDTAYVPSDRRPCDACWPVNHHVGGHQLGLVPPTTLAQQRCFEV